MNHIKSTVIAIFTAWFAFVMPFGSVHAVSEDCAGCGQGIYQGVDQGIDQGMKQDAKQEENQDAKQGVDQGKNQGGPTLEELGAEPDEEGKLVLPEDVSDTRQGATQGKGQGDPSYTAKNTNTGSGSTNTIESDVGSKTSADISNVSVDTTKADVTGNTGSNTANANTGKSSVDTGNAGVGVTQVKQNNTTTKNGDVGLNVAGHDGQYTGDMELDFETIVAYLTGKSGIRAVNDTTGADSENAIKLSTSLEELFDVHNDGEIHNALDLHAMTGDNDASYNTGGGSIKTGDANVAATLINLLNTTVINGNLSISVQDIFGDFLGDVIIPDLAQLARLLAGGVVNIDAANEHTGSDSENTIDIALKDTERTSVDNKADIDTAIHADAVTGNNDASYNTGGGSVKTGDAKVSAGQTSIANTTIEGGNWALVIVNALNRWVGFLVGDSGEVRELTPNETVDVYARNTNTGADSDNSIDISSESERVTNVDNAAKITNEVNASAVTGNNTAMYNTGAGDVETGNANVLANIINLANTTLLNASLHVSVVNVFGSWMGNILHAGSSLFGGSSEHVGVAARNASTGSDSDNAITVDIDTSKETNVSNTANVDTLLHANIQTGGNKASGNTMGGSIETGDGLLSLHSQTVANITGVSGKGGLGVEADMQNKETGVTSTNTIQANINSTHVLSVKNDAHVNTYMPATVNTGNNEASYNTGGGSIVTGIVDARTAVRNMINHLLVGSGQGGSSVHLDAENIATGFGSQNSNVLDVLHGAFVTLLNNAHIDTIIDLFLNTGGNVASSNTGGAHISTGVICGDVDVHNDVNTWSGIGGGANITSVGDIMNMVKADAQTGLNAMLYNTGVIDGKRAEEECPPKKVDEVVFVPIDKDKDIEKEEREDVEKDIKEEREDVEKKDIEKEEVPVVPEEEKRVGIVKGIRDEVADRIDRVVEVPRLAVAGVLDEDVIWTLFGVMSTGMLVGAVQGDRRGKKQ